MSLCSKPGCGHAGAIVLGYDYAARVASLEDPPEGRPDPHVYVLCTSCAERLRPPVGWTLDDRRTKPPLFVSESSDEAADVVADLSERDVARRAETEAPSRARLFTSSA